MKSCAREIARYVVNNKNYNRNLLREGLSNYGMKLVSLVFDYVKDSPLYSDGTHFGRIADDILHHYEKDNKRTNLIDGRLAELERVLRKETLEMEIKREDASACKSPS